jgi:hypothetical protein
VGHSAYIRSLNPYPTRVFSGTTGLLPRDVVLTVRFEEIAIASGFARSKEVKRIHGQPNFAGSFKLFRLTRRYQWLRNSRARITPDDSQAQYRQETTDIMTWQSDVIFQCFPRVSLDRAIQLQA